MFAPPPRVCVVALLLPLPAHSENSAGPVTLDPIEVTGTRLGRPLAESPISHTVVTREMLQNSGRARLGEVLRELPEFPSNPVTEMVAFNSARGVTAADLRGLGSGNTLVLVNGRRTTTNASVFDVTTTFVDMNRFAPAFVERVEILKGGASAVYGADAVGGVLNIITRRQPAGGEAVLSYGNTVKSDAAETSASIATGVTRGALGLSFGVDLLHRNAQAHRDRWFTRTANLIPRYASAYDYYAQLPAPLLANYDGRSLTSAHARFAVVAGQVNGQNGVNIPGLAAGAAITTLPGTGGTAVGTLASATPNFATPFRNPTGGRHAAAAAASFVEPELTKGDPTARSFFDFNEHIWTTPAAERAAMMGRLDYQTAGGLLLFAEMSGGRNRSRTEYHARDFSGVVPRTNAFNPFGVDVSVAWRIPDAGPRRSLTEDDHVAAQAGVRSRPRAALAWELGGTYSRDEFVDTTTNLYQASKVRTALASADPATALNPFGGADYRQSPALIDALRADAWFGGRADLLVLDAQASGQLLALPAGPLRGVAFVERRRERFSSVSDPLSRDADILGYGKSGADLQAQREVSAVAAELHAPLWAGRAGENRPRLALETAARWERFEDSFKSGIRPTVGLVAIPVRGLLLRASEARTFRAPSLPQLFTPQGDGYYNDVSDPRRPSALTGDLYDGSNVSRLVRQGGNPALQPETGRVRQAGGTWEPPRVKGLALDATWFRYDLRELIAGISPTYVLKQELGGLAHLVHREPGTQTYTNRTSAPIPVLSGPAGETTLVAPGQSATVPGRLSRIDIFTVNLSRRQLEGWDFGARQSFEVAGARVVAAASGTYIHVAAGAYDEQSPLVNGAGQSSSPRWRARGSVDWSRGRWTAGATMSYTARSGYHDPWGYYQKPYRVVHLRAGYRAPAQSWLRGLQFNVGLDDIFNETPPLFPDPPIGFHYGMVSRPQGRFWRATVTRRW